MDRVLAQSSAIAGAVVFLYLMDLFYFCTIDPIFRLMWTLNVAEGGSFLTKNGGVLLGLVWGGIWLLSALQAFKPRVTRRTALCGLAIVIGGIFAVAAIHHWARLSQ